MTDKQIAKISYEIDEQYSQYKIAEEQNDSRLMQGTVAKFTKDFRWVTGKGKATTELPPDLKLLLMSILRVVQKWAARDDRKFPIETIIVPRGEKLNVDAMNDDTPKREWVKGADGKLGGPWQFQYICYFLNLKTMKRFTYPVGTIGGGIAVRELEQSIDDQQDASQTNVRPVVQLRDTPWSTRLANHNDRIWKSSTGASSATKKLKKKRFLHRRKRKKSPSATRPRSLGSGKTTDRKNKKKKRKRPPVFAASRTSSNTLSM